MNTINPEIQDPEITLIDIIQFFRRQWRFITTVFLCIYILVLSFVFTRPFTYESKANLIIGTKFFFTNQNQNPFLIETPEQIKHLYSQRAQVAPVKNTAVVQILSKANNKEQSINDVKLTINEILMKHNEFLQTKKDESIRLLKLKDRQSEESMFELIDKISASNFTKQDGVIQTTELPYQGILKMGLATGFLAALFLAFLSAFTYDYYVRRLK